MKTFFEWGKNTAEEILTRYSLILELPKDDPQVKLCALTLLDFALEWRNCLYINEGSLAYNYLVNLRKQIEEYGNDN